MTRWIMGLGASLHNGAVCLLKDDEIVVAIQEERLVRAKRAALFGGEYSHAVEFCLDYAKIRPRDLSLVVCCSVNPARLSGERHSWLEAKRCHDVSKNPILDTIANQVPTLNIPHHYGHAVSAFATSGFEESAVLVVDGLGSSFEDFKELESESSELIDPDGWETSSLYSASSASIRCLEKHVVKQGAWLTREPVGMPRYGGLGGMYAATGAQIFGDLFESAGKVMGLAPYGEPVIPASEFFSIDDARFIFGGSVRNRFKHDDRWPHRQKEYADLASSVQAALEEAILYLVNRLHKISRSKNLCYAGGVALNSVANERIIRESPFENVYIFPAAEDSGTAIGAAYYGLWQMTRTNTRKPLVHDAVGPAYSDQDIRSAIEATPAVEEIACEDVISRTVDLLCEGKIIGWFEGRSELGPRALGQRSILCDARRSDAKDVLNSRVKHRESFRPFAPVVLRESVEDWFDLEGASHDSPFMLRICKFKEDKRALVPGVVHVDATGRFQTVTREANGPLYDVVRRFHDKTGVPILLNTSFNIAGEPIVEKPVDALSTMLRTGIDYCVLGGHLVGKRRSIILDRDVEPWPERIARQVRDITRSGSAAPKQASEIDEAGRRRLSYVGVFERETPGTVMRVEADEKELTATLTGELIQIMGGRLGRAGAGSHVDATTSVVCPIRETQPYILVVTKGVLAGFKMVFPPDRSGGLSCVVLQRGDEGTAGITFLRQADTAFSADSKDRFEGEYGTPDQQMTVTFRDGKLTAGVPGEARFELSQVARTQFILRNLPGYGVEFREGTSGIALEAMLTLPSRVLILPRH